VLRNDLALRVLIRRAALVTVLFLSWVMLYASIVDDPAVDDNRNSAAVNLALAAPALVGAGLLLFREWRRQAAVSRLLNAWLRMIEHPAVRGALAQRRAGVSAPERAHVRAQIEDRGHVGPGPGPTSSDILKLNARRLAWRLAGGVALFFGFISLAGVLITDGLEDSVAAAGMALILLVAGSRALWKSLERRYRAGER
jgi:hypothetical protein